MGIDVSRKTFRPDIATNHKAGSFSDIHMLGLACGTTRTVTVLLGRQQIPLHAQHFKICPY